MEKIKTVYGEIKGISSVVIKSKNDNEKIVLEALKVERENEIEVSGIKLTPRYSDETGRRKDTAAISFYKYGEYERTSEKIEYSYGPIKGISLQEATDIKTDLGIFQAEKITFYKSGKIKRLFLLDGKISGYWSEEDEYNLAESHYFIFEFGSFETKVISLQFYENGLLKSLTLWPKNIVSIKTSLGLIEVRIGIALYESGKLKSCEPNRPIKVQTPIGNIEAYDENAIGIHGEKNSLEFYENGEIKSLITTKSQFEVYDKEGNLVKKITPRVVKNHIVSSLDEVITVKVEFVGDMVIFDESLSYNIKHYNFKINKEKVFVLA